MKRKFEADSPTHKHILNLNIGGTTFVLARDTILSKPGTRLAKLITSDADSAHKDRYYFDRKPDLFPLVQDFYRTGIFNLAQVDDDKVELLEDELKFWEITIPCPYKRIKTKALRNLGEIKKKVEIFLDCLVRNRMKKKTVPPVYDFYLQSANARLPLHFSDMTKLKTVSAEDYPYQSAGTNMVLLAERICQGTNFPLSPQASKRFISPIGQIMKVCKNIMDFNEIIKMIYNLVYDDFDTIVEDALKYSLPGALIEVICKYTRADNGGCDYSDPIFPEYLPMTFYIYHRIIRGFTLFDRDNEKSRIARNYATRYLNEKGIRAQWRQRKILCRDALALHSSFPFDNMGHEFYSPVYKCSECRKLPKYNIGHMNELNIWYLRFDWTAG